MTKHTASACPCQSGNTFADCCGPYLAGTATPDCAEALMRSRYSAYTRADAPYLLGTWHRSTRPDALDLDAEATPKWIGLQVKRHERTGADTAIVEFIARYRIGGRAHRLHETSAFVREDGRWLYVDGDLCAS